MGIRTTKEMKNEEKRFKKKGREKKQKMKRRNQK